MIYIRYYMTHRTARYWSRKLKMVYAQRYVDIKNDIRDAG